MNNILPNRSSMHYVKIDLISSNNHHVYNEHTNVKIGFSIFNIDTYIRYNYISDRILIFNICIPMSEIDTQMSKEYIHV